VIFIRSAGRLSKIHGLSSPNGPRSTPGRAHRGPASTSPIALLGSGQSMDPGSALAVASAITGGGPRRVALALDSARHSAAVSSSLGVGDRLSDAIYGSRRRATCRVVGVGAQAADGIRARRDPLDGNSMAGAPRGSRAAGSRRRRRGRRGSAGQQVGDLTHAPR